VQTAVQRQSLLSYGETFQAMDTVLGAVLSRPRDDSRQGGLQFFWEHSLGQGLHDGSSVGAPA